MKSFLSERKHIPTPNVVPAAPASAESPLRQVFRSPDLRRVLPGLALSALLANLLAVALPLAILQIMDRVVANQALETLAFLVVGIVMALILEGVLRSINGLVTSWLGARFEHNASVAALDRMMRVPMRRYQAEKPSAYAERILAASKVAQFYSGQALMVLFDLPFAVIFLGLIYVIGGWLVLVPLLLMAIFAVLSFHFGRRMRNQIDQRHTMDDRRFDFLTEVFSNIHSVKTMTMEGLLRRRYERLQEANAETGEALTRATSQAANMRMLFSQVMIVAVVFAGSWGVIAGQMTPGGLAACILLSVRALQPLRQGLSAWLRYQSFATAHERLDELMSIPCDNDHGKPTLTPVREGIELRDINLRHERRGAPLFSGLSLKVKAGQCVAIRGNSGSGKTSLLSLINGLMQPDSGAVLIDGRPIHDFAADSIHREVAFLPQTPAIIAGTILENMTMYDRSLNQQALTIAHQLGLDQTVARMRLGYETPLGEGVSETLPEGVRQLITIVRALARNPSVILFDEANISLDLEGDKLLRDYLAERKGKCTVVLVTPRPSLVSLADQVYTLAEGRLVEAATESRQGATPATADAAAAVPERPGRTEDISVVVRRQFDEESDLSSCLLPLLTAVHWTGNPKELAEAMPHLAQRLDLSGLCSIMSNLDYQPKHFASTLEHLDPRLMPCLFVPAERQAMVVLESRPNGHLWVFDSALGTETEVAPGSEEGDIYLFHKPDMAVNHSHAHLSWFGTLLWRLRRHVALAFLLTAVSTLLALAAPLFVMLTYDRVIPAGDITMGAYLLLGVAIALGLDWVLRGLKNGVMAYIGGRTEYILGSSVFQRILSLPATSTEGASVSRQVGRIKNLEGLREFFLGPLALLAFELPASLILLVAMVFINPWVVGVVVLSGGAFAFLALGTRGFSEKSVMRSSQLSGSRWEFLNESLVHMRAIRALGAGKLWVKRFRDMSGKAVMANFRDGQLQSRIGSVAQVLGMTTGLLALAASAYLAIKGDLTGGAMIATMMIAWRLTGPMQNVFLATTSLVQIRSQMRQIEHLMRLPGERDSGVRQTLRPEVHGALGFSRVSFRYANDADPALLGVNFAVQPGQVVVLAGPSGSGKSTLLKLLVRVYAPQAGTIRLDNVDIRQLTVTDLRARISYMPQNCDVFYGTVVQNMRLVCPAATDDEVRWAVEMAGLTEDIQAMPQGFETRISNNLAEQLPHGFLQRLSLARAILKPASVVLLDEPGGGMDQAGEDALIRCIQWLRGRSTVLMVSHRPGHMRLADTVVFLEHGAVTAMGPFDQIKDKIMSGLR